jgi:hypothetical protein
MSELSLEADMPADPQHVGFVPKADLRVLGKRRCAGHFVDDQCRPASRPAGVDRDYCVSKLFCIFSTI